MSKNNTDRRHFLKRSIQGLGITLAAGQLPVYAQPGPNTSSQPGEKTENLQVLYETDLFHPHGDPDDHFDLATVYLLAKQGYFDLLEIMLDYPPPHRSGDPGIIPVAQMNRLCGLGVPTCIGSSVLLKKRNDTLPELDHCDCQSVDTMISTLRKAKGNVAIVCVGSSSDIVLAANREPELFREKCAGVWLNAGSGTEEPDKQEYNTRLNPQAYAGMFDLPCPLYWFPCWHYIEKRQSSEWGSFYWLPHEKAFRGISDPLRMYFEYMFKKSGEMKYLRFLEGRPDEAFWSEINTQNRGMWSTASLFLMAQLTVTKQGEIVPLVEIEKKDELFRMEPITAQCGDDGRVQWQLTDQSTNRFLFHVLDAAIYPDAMARAINSLFRTLS